MNIICKKFFLNLNLKMPFYSVARGRKTGVYQTWPECEAQVKGFTGAVYKKFPSNEEAEKFVLSKGGMLLAKISTANIPNANSLKRSYSSSSSTTNATINSTTNAKKLKIDDKTQTKSYGKYDFLEDSSGFVHVYTDGSCEGNGTNKAVAGLGVYFAENHDLNIAKSVSGRATNNCGEIQACTLAIKLAAENKIQKLCINTDSQFVINSVTKWMKGWKSRGWKLASGQPVKNQIDFLDLDKILQENKNMTIKWNYVKAHDGILGNERADALAKQGGEIYRAITTSK